MLRRWCQPIRRSYLRSAEISPELRQIGQASRLQMQPSVRHRHLPPRRYRRHRQPRRPSPPLTCMSVSGNPAGRQSIPAWGLGRPLSLGDLDDRDHRIAHAGRPTELPKIDRVHSYRRTLAAISPTLLVRLVPQEGIEPPTHALRMRCSTPELLRHAWGACVATRIAAQPAKGKDAARRPWPVQIAAPVAIS